MQKAGSIILTVFVVVLVVPFIKPFLFASIYPLALAANSFFADVHSHTMLLSSLPFSDVLSAISPNKCALSFAFVVYKVTFILLAISPHEFALAVHLILFPVATVGLSVWPVVVTVPRYFVLMELAFVIAAICKC